ncbi:MAG: carbohydrate ABC transporter permease [Rhodobacteraceae bacterium]|nr:carbohydrate ABC transporter permease [Paracoccaceae bacterium]
MSFLRYGYILSPLIGVAWSFLVATTVAIVMAFTTGGEYAPSALGLVFYGIVMGLFGLRVNLTPITKMRQLILFNGMCFFLPLFTHLYNLSPVVFGENVSFGGGVIAILIYALGMAWPLLRYYKELGWNDNTRHQLEDSIIKALTGMGFVVFTILVLVPFYVMVMTSLKSQQELLLNPLDFGLDLSKGWDLFRSYIELFRDFNFGRYILISFFISIVTVIITLLFSVPGAYAIARFRFAGQGALSRSILLIYMVPMIVLALPIYIAFSITGLRDTIAGIVLIYPVTTIPVALYMLQGYFRGLPREVEEAGLMDGLSRIVVIIKITLPLSLPAMASVSLYVFMIAWNEFLLAFMLLDNPKIFTLTRGVASLNSSEIPRQHLMAGAVISTVPIIAIFMGLERFMTRGLTAGSVKG